MRVFHLAEMGISVFYGDIGTGKTSLTRCLWEKFASNPVYDFAMLVHFRRADKNPKRLFVAVLYKLTTYSLLNEPFVPDLFRIHVWKQ